MTFVTEGWRKSSYSAFNGNCVEVWRKSSYSESNGHCVEWRKSSRSYSDGHCTEVASQDGVVLVRDSQLGDASPVLSFSPADWREFTEGIKGGPPTPG